MGTAPNQIQKKNVTNTFEKTLQHMLYFHLVTDLRFRIDFIEWVGFKGLGEAADVEIVLEKSGRGVRYDISLLGNDVQRNIELKVWAPLTKGQTSRRKSLHLVIAPEPFPSWLEPFKKVSWQHLQRKFSKKFSGLGEFLFRGNRPDARLILGEITKFTSDPRYEPEVFDMFLNRIWWTAAAEDLNGWDYIERWYRNASGRWLGFTYKKQTKQGDLFCWIGLIWNRELDDAHLVIEVSSDQSLDLSRYRKSHRVPKSCFSPKWFEEVRSGEIAFAQRVGKLDAEKAAEQLSRVLKIDTNFLRS